MPILRLESNDALLLAIRMGDLTSLAPHERLPELAVVPREKPHTGAAARGKPRGDPRSRDEGLHFLHGVMGNDESSLQTPQEA